METDTQEHEYSPPVLFVVCISWEEQRTWSGCNLECFIGDMTISKPHHGTSYSNSLLNRFDVSSASPSSSSSYKLSLRSLNRLGRMRRRRRCSSRCGNWGAISRLLWQRWSSHDKDRKIGKKEGAAAVGCDATHGRWVSWSDWETSDAEEEEEQKINKLHP